MTIDTPFADAAVHDLAARRQARRVTAVTAAMAPRTGPRPRLDAGGARLRVRALHVMGHGSARIARALSVREETIQKIVRGDTRTISPHLRDAITALYDTWWDKRAPERTRAERAAAARARSRAASGNWCAGAGLDDAKLDTPGYRPRTPYRPACGTGTAPDIRLTVRHHRTRKGA